MFHGLGGYFVAIQEHNSNGLLGEFYSAALSLGSRISLRMRVGDKRIRLNEGKGMLLGYPSLEAIC